jgi:hypothetical protein
MQIKLTEKIPGYSQFAEYRCPMPGEVYLDYCTYTRDCLPCIAGSEDGAYPWIILKKEDNVRDKVKKALESIKEDKPESAKVTLMSLVEELESEPKCK